MHQVLENTYVQLTAVKKKSYTVIETIDVGIKKANKDARTILLEYLKYLRTARTLRRT